MRKSSLERISLVERTEPGFFHYISIYTQLLGVILHIVVVIKHLAFISLNISVKHLCFLLHNKKIKSTKSWCQMANSKSWNHVELLIWEQEFGWGVRVWNKKLFNKKKYFLSDCALFWGLFLLYFVSKEQFPENKCGVRDTQAVWGALKRMNSSWLLLYQCFIL